MDDETFGQQLVTARRGKTRPWSRSRLAKAAHDTATHIRDVEMGAKLPPQPEQVLALCEAARINPTPLLRAAIRERGTFELDIPPDRDDVVAFCADLAMAWSSITVEQLQKMRALLGTRA